LFQDHYQAAGEDVLVILIPERLTSSRSLLDWLDAALNLPDYFGFNWNALSDCLRDLSCERLIRYAIDDT